MAQERVNFDANQKLNEMAQFKMAIGAESIYGNDNITSPSTHILPRFKATLQI
ncbi:MAG: hypothetical protein P4M12_06355 [Gammaproteobacteria bacterium]|nr:hypothetical protein [Gammaproteobacteria bacterium]